MLEKWHVGFFAWAMLVFSPVICAQEEVFHEVDIVGLENVGKEDLREILKPFVGKPFDEKAKRALTQKFEDISMFSQVTLKTSLKNRLQLFVRERKPYAKIDFQKLWFVDQDGILFTWFGSGKMPDAPWIKGPWKNKTTLKKSNDTLASGVALIRSFDQGEIVPKALYWDASLGWSFVAEEMPIPFYIGKDRFDSKIERLIKIWPKMMSQKDKILRVDANFRDRIVVKLRPPTDS